jgi:succinoglycan biosynthesis transport protein ExoP
VKIVQEGQANLLTIKASDPSPGVAARTANAYAFEYVRFRREAGLSDLRARERFLESELARIPESRLGGARANSIRRELRRLSVDSPAPGVARIMSTARPATSPSSPKPLRNTVLAGLVGLFLAGIVALLFERLDPRLKTPREAEAIFDRPILGIVHRSRALSRPVTGRLPLHDFDSFLALRAYLRYVGPKRGLRSVLLTSGASGDGKTTVAWNLACAAAAPERRVLLIEADVRAPILASALKLKPETGVGDVLAGRAGLHDVVRDVAVESSQNGRTPARIVSVAFAGSDLARAADPFEWERLGEALAAERDFDLIVIDTAPLVSVHDAVPLLSHVDGVIVIGRIGNTPRAALARLKDQLETVDAPTVGVVVNAVGKEAQYGYGSGYPYGPQVNAG